MLRTSEKLQAQIDAFLKEPLKVNDIIIVNNGKYDESFDAVKIDSEYAYYSKYGYKELFKIPLNEVRKSYLYVGVDRFKKEILTNQYQIDIEQLLYRFGFNHDGYEDSKNKYFEGISEINFEPFVFDSDGNKVYYQRGLVWDLKEKQLLIESIFNNIEIGKFVLRDRGYNYVENNFKNGNIKDIAFKDVVDGKQRFNAILGFIKNEFPDVEGNYFYDLSAKCKNEFLGYRNLFYCELPESTTDQEVIETFLAINFTGVPMNREHINYIKNIKLK